MNSGAASSMSLKGLEYVVLLFAGRDNWLVIDHKACRETDFVRYADAHIPVSYTNLCVPKLYAQLRCFIEAPGPGRYVLCTHIRPSNARAKYFKTIR